MVDNQRQNNDFDDRNGYHLNTALEMTTTVDGRNGPRSSSSSNVNSNSNNNSSNTFGGRNSSCYYRPIEDEMIIYNYPDWLALRAIYGEGEMQDDDDDDDDDNNNNDDDGMATTTATITTKKVRLQESWMYYVDCNDNNYNDNDCEDETKNTFNTTNDKNELQKRQQQRRSIFFCGTITMGASSHTFQTQVAFARRVTKDEKYGDYRYFCLVRPPSIQIQLLYRPHNINQGDEYDNDDDEYDNDEYDNNDYDNDDDDEEHYGPIQVRVQWDYYPIEWPQCDKDDFCKCLQNECDKLLSQSTPHPTTGFDICEFLEHHLIDSYGRYQRQRHELQQASVVSDGGGGVHYWRLLQSKNRTTKHNTMRNGEDQKLQNNNDDDDDDKADDDKYNPNGYQLYILPPEYDKLYQENYGTLSNPRKEAAIVAQTVRKSSILKRLESKPEKSKPSTRSSTKTRSTRTNVHRTSSHPPLYAQANNVLEFAKLSLIEHWKQLYTTTCPICFEDNVLFEDGITFKKCQHYCCHECFRTYLTYKVNDLSQHRTNPFLCPVETCTDRELPFATICRRYLGPQEQQKVAQWYRDLTFPPCWSLDRCLNINECGAVGSMRRKAMPPKKKTSVSSSTLPTRRLSRQRDHYDHEYNYHRQEQPPAAMGGFFHHGVVFPADQERDAKNRQEKQVQDEIKRRTQVKALSTSSSSLICCEECNTTWCELCLQRVPPGHEHAHYDRRGYDGTDDYDSTNKIGESNANRPTRCQPQAALTFSRQYMEASEDKQEEIRMKFPWIASYALFCQHDGAAVEYLQESGGQRCPNCRAGVQRIEGCFHMKCPSCATHFCYECGDELFPPYYGTHHCWEEVGNIAATNAQDARELAQRQRQNRLDEELATRLMLEEALGVELPNFDL